MLIPGLIINANKQIAAKRNNQSALQSLFVDQYDQPAGPPLKLPATTPIPQTVV